MIILEKAGMLLISVALCATVVYLFFRSFSTAMKEKGRVLYYRLLCVSVFFWVLMQTCFIAAGDDRTALIFFMVRYVFVAFTSTNLLLCIWQQIRFKPLPKLVVAICFILPSISSALILTNSFTGYFLRDIALYGALNRQVSMTYAWGYYYHVGLSYISVFMSVVMLFRILILLPRKLRAPIYFMVLGLAATVFGNALVLIDFYNFYYDITVLGLVICNILVYMAINVTRSANIMITSSDYVLNNLSSILLVLDKQRLILTHSHTNDKALWGSAEPKYLELYDDFVKRWISSGNGRISQHDVNIVTFTERDSEEHYRLLLKPLVEYGDTHGYIVEISKITEIYKLLRYMEESAFYDQLTGLYNRNAYLRRIQNIDNESCLPLAVIVGDVNNLKQVNDQTGHLAGDQLLKVIADTLKECAPENSFVARIGGDEFIMLLERSTESDGQSVADKVTEICGGIRSDVFGIASISMGVAVKTSKDEDINDVISKADYKMYANKRKNSTGVRRRY